MPAPTPPTLLEAIASSAGSSFITNPMPNSPTGTNAASIQGGFPPITMTNEQAGGEPPLGQDMNGLMFLVSSHTLYVESGQLYPYSSALSTAIGGYALGTILGMADGTGIWMSIVNNNTSNPDTGGAGWIAIASYGMVSVPVTTGTVVLTTAQYKRSIIQITGTLTGNVTIQLPTGIVDEWLFSNAATGAFTVTVTTTASGSGVVIPQGGFVTPTGVYTVGDGNVYPIVTPLGVAIDQNPNPLTIVERTNTAQILASSFLMTLPTENSAVSTVVFQKSGDGTMRNIGLTNFEAQLLLQAMGGQVTNGQVPFSVVSQWASALFANAALTGVPTAPTAGAGTSNTQIATTGFANPGVTVNANGICINLPSGYKIQASLVNPAGGTISVTWPVAFTSLVYAVPGSLNNGSAVQSWFKTVSLTGGTLANTGGQSYYIAVGI